MQMFNQHINNLSLSINYQRGKVVSFLLSLIVGIIISIVIATYLTANGASATTYKTSWIGNTFGGGDKWASPSLDKWSKGNRTPRWRTVVPYDTTGKREVSTAAMSVAGDYVFAVEGENRRSICLQDSNGSGSSKVKTWCRGEKRKWLD
jgi:hypothetical protein